MKQHCKISQQPLISDSELISRWLQLTPLLIAFWINTSQVQKVAWGLTQSPGPDIVMKARWWLHKYFKIWLTLSLPKAMSKPGVAGRRTEDFNEKVWTLWWQSLFVSNLRLFYASILGFQTLRSHPGWPLALRCNSIPLAPQFTVLFLGGFLCLFPWMSSR